jgi:hypothetical protein
MMQQHKHIEWDVAEVLEYDYISICRSRIKMDQLLINYFASKVRSCSTKFNKNRIFISKPANINIKQIPLVGEFVLMFKTLNEESTQIIGENRWYYVNNN